MSRIKFILLLFLLLILFIFRNNISNFEMFTNKEKNDKIIVNSELHLNNIKNSEKEIITSEENIDKIQKDIDELNNEIMEEEDNINESSYVKEESKRSLIKIVDESFIGCPFDHYEKESPCKKDFCITNPISKECKEYINKFCYRKDLDKKNKIGCDIYFKVLNDKSLLPRGEPLSRPAGPPVELAQLIPQFIEKDMIQ